MRRMHPIAVVWKKRGQTPLEALEGFRRRKGIDPSVPISYAGRLDQLAEGKLLLAVGKEACQARDKLLGLDKRYEMTFALGLSSDSGDVFGRVSFEWHVQHEASEVRKKLRSILPQYHGPYSCRYHPFSSKPVTGSKTGERRPLWYFAAHNRLAEVGIPSKDTFIYRLALVSVWEYPLAAVAREALAALALVTPTHRQLQARLQAAQKDWEVLRASNERLVLVRIVADVSSGLYMRTLAQDIAAQLHTRAVVLSLVRRKIGRYRRFGPFAWYRGPVL